jgi:hypothetical protein
MVVVVVLLVGVLVVGVLLVGVLVVGVLLVGVLVVVVLLVGVFVVGGDAIGWHCPSHVAPPGGSQASPFTGSTTPSPHDDSAAKNVTCSRFLPFTVAAMLPHVGSIRPVTLSGPETPGQVLTFAVSLVPVFVALSFRPPAQPPKLRLLPAMPTN